ncbi:isoprenylcysteine carboxylmethyltransferase family protein [Pseudonocardia yunnanensis]|uniref:Methyltransferase family protein n=1 Tax=Pseudonocardia yunnanensis TaxID=58107 RepID=A0ABW4F4J6_9PSEU
MSAAGWAWVALLLYLAGLVLAFGVRTWLQIRWTGTSGFRGISGQSGSAAWWGGVLFPIALLLGLAAPVLMLTGITAPVLPAHPGLAAAGIIVGLAGLVVVLLAQAAMGSSWRIGVDDTERTELITSGLFRSIRNPIFTGMAAVCAGVALMAPTLVAVLALACLIAAVQIQVRVVEEPYLRRVHGDTYSHYAAGAGRFLPGLGRARPADAKARTDAGT